MFKYEVAFARNLGWVSPQEQEKIKNSKIAIGGLGGVGGDEAIALARIGFQNFHIADLDDFDYSNFNRQSGANIETVGKPKADITAKEMKKINPNMNIKIFSEGANRDNIDEFLDGVDIYVDSLDIFAVDARRTVFNACGEKKIPALTAAPLAFGMAFACFTHDSMSFDDYFGLKDPDSKVLAMLEKDPSAQILYKIENYAENVIKFITGVAPAALQRHYLLNPDRVNLFRKDLPSIKPGIELASGIMCVNVLKLLLGRGDVFKAPHGLQFDCYLNKYAKTWRPFGHRNPLMIVMRSIIRKKIELEPKFKAIKPVVRQMVESGQLDSNVSEREMYKLMSQIGDE